MKIKLFLAAIAISFSTISFGQSKTAMSADELKQKAMDLTEEMTTYLNLSETQVERVKGLNYSLLKKKDEFMAQEGMSAEDRATKLKAFEERHTATVKQVLDEEQFKKFQAKYADKKMMKVEKVKTK